MDDYDGRAKAALSNFFNRSFMVRTGTSAPSLSSRAPHSQTMAQHGIATPEAPAARSSRAAFLLARVNALREFTNFVSPPNQTPLNLNNALADGANAPQAQGPHRRCKEKNHESLSLN